MFIKYGSYTHAANEGLITFSAEAKMNEAMQSLGVKWTCNIQGKLYADSQSALTTAIAALETAYSQKNVSLTLLHDDSTTARQVLFQNTVGGIRLMRPVSFPNGGTDAEYTTWRSYDIGLEWEYDTALSSALLSFDEVIKFSGGGPVYMYLKPTEGTPIRVKLMQNDSYRATQQGSAVGLYAYPTPPEPLWVSEQQMAGEITPHTPKRRGDNFVKYREYQIDWSYTFESAAPLIGEPTLWVG